MQEALKKPDVKEEDIKPFFEKILQPTLLDDKEMLLPVDMRGVEKEYEGIDELIQELKPVEAAKALLKARTYFTENTEGKWPDADKPAPLSGAEWKKILQEETEEDVMEDDDDEDLLEADEEELCDEDPEGEEEEEPPAKKAKTE
ncbi:unnamed protein product [Symbiodinium pilosum]|uniref:Uncharacterized protein n=1 Tax=Symbiodinium pilosum TaxID=2952 RepID=A0A812X4D7_SYMPI|nr:unnamed protein product [Symbiodinium pilosum]